MFYRREGTAITLMTRGDWRQAKGLIDILVEANQVILLIEAVD